MHTKTRERLPLVMANPEPICPYCGILLQRMPVRKKQCPACTQPIFPRTRASDRVRVLMTAEQAEANEDQWQAYHQEKRLQGRWGAAFEHERQFLREQFGQAPTDRDVEWSLLVKELEEHQRRQAWGDYRNTRLGMAEVLVADGRTAAALGTYLSICYLDLNGPLNHGRRFDPTDGFLAPGVLYTVRELAERLDSGQATLKSQFLTEAQRVRQTVRAPVAPEEAWTTLERELAG